MAIAAADAHRTAPSAGSRQRAGPGDERIPRQQDDAIPSRRHRHEQRRSPRRRSAKIISTRKPNGTARAAGGLVAACRRLGGGRETVSAIGRGRMLRRRGAARRRHDLSDAIAERLDLVLPIVEQVDPLPRGQLVGERSDRRHVFDARRNDRNLVLAGQRQLLLDLGRVVSVSEKTRTITLADRMALTIESWKFSPAPTSRLAIQQVRPGFRARRKAFALPFGPWTNG